MKRLLVFILPCILVACAAAPGQTMKTPGGAAFEQSDFLASTVEAETHTRGSSAHTATFTPSMSAPTAGETATTETLTPQPSETSLPSVPPNAPACHPADLKASFGSNGATQQILLSAGLTNTSASPCFLQVWPQVTLVDRLGQPLDVDYHYLSLGVGNPGFAATKRAQEYATARVGLWPGWSVWVNLIWQNWCGVPVSGGVFIQLGFNGSTGTLTLPTDIQTGGICNAPAQRSSVGIAQMVLIPVP